MKNFGLGTVFGLCLMAFVAMYQAGQANRWYTLYNEAEFETLVWKNADIADQKTIIRLRRQVENLHQWQPLAAK